MLDRSHEQVTAFAPYLCTTGYFSGKWIQAELTGESAYSCLLPCWNVCAEAQKGDRARKMGEGKDARGLDPPPVARVKVFQCDQRGRRLRELDPRDIVAHVLLACAITLYPYNISYEQDPSSFPDGCPTPSPILPEGSTSSVLAVEKRHPPALPARPLRPLAEKAMLTTHASGLRQVPTITGALWVHAQYCPQAFGDGSSNGAMYFVFDDVKVRRTGHFVLKYQMFLVDSAISATGSGLPLLAQCWGGVFAVYPSKSVPPLAASTLLTLHLSRYGLISRARTSERQHRRRSHDQTNGADEGDGDAGTSRSTASIGPVSQSSTSQMPPELPRPALSWPSTLVAPSAPSAPSMQSTARPAKRPRLPYDPVYDN